MATKLTDIPNLERQISGKQDEQGSYQDKLNASATALGGSGQPTKTDISNQESYNRLKKEITALQDKRAKTKWYGTDEYKNEEDTGAQMGMIGKTLDWITKPLYGIVGATKHLVGQGTGSLQEDISGNMLREKNTFGDVLRTSNVPGAVAAPLGFALDIFADPLNWATMGTSALIPKIGYGAYKGLKAGKLLEGISTASKAGLLEKAATVSRFTPILRKSKTMEKLGKKTIEATKRWERLSGITPEKLITQRGMGVGAHRVGLRDVVDNVASKVPGGEEALKHFVYDPVGWVERARTKDMLQQLLGAGVEETKGAVSAVLKGESSVEYLNKGKAAFAKKVEEAGTSTEKIFGSVDSGKKVNLMKKEEVEKGLAAISNKQLADKAEAVSDTFVRGVDEATSIKKNPAVYNSGDPVENALRLFNEEKGGSAISMKELGEIMNSGALGETGVKWYDNMIKGVKDYTLAVGKNKKKILVNGKKTLDMYDRGMAIFRLAKVALSPTAWTNAIAGNLIMAHMSGGLSPRFLKRLGQASLMYGNQKGASAKVDKIITQASVKFGYNPDHISNLMKTELKTASKNTLGSIDFLDTNATMEKLLRSARDSGKISSKVKKADIKESVQKALDELSEVKAGAGTSQIRKLAREGKGDIAMSEVSGGQLSNELFEKEAARRMFTHIEKQAKANPNNMAWKLLDWSINKAPSGYESLDQISKMGSFLTSIADGYSVNQLRQMRHLVQISAEELSLGKTVLEGTGEILYRLSPESALKLANSQFLNYAAMPSAVKVLRNMPVMGSPFISFMYGMSLKTGQTLAYNPSAFNKVEFALKEFGGQKTPLEKRALETSRYSYLNEPGMLRNPFENESPVYYNLSSMIPYYSLNMFNPAQTNYGDSVSEKLTQMAQGSPFMKDPVGSTLFNYIIQPLILKEGIRPQGQFGQPLYPLDATALEKALYGARTLAEAYVPNVASYAGLFTSEAVAELIPSYRWRQLAYAKKGKSQLGISGKESKEARTWRTFLQASGISKQAPMNTTFTKKDK